MSAGGKAATQWWLVWVTWRDEKGRHWADRHGPFRDWGEANRAFLAIRRDGIADRGTDASAQLVEGGDHNRVVSTWSPGERSGA